MSLQKLLQPYTGLIFNDLAETAEVRPFSVRTLRKGRTVQCYLAIRVFEQLGVEPPCKIEDVNSYMRSLWDSREQDDRLVVSAELGLHYTTIDKWIYLQNVQPNFVNFLLFCKHVSDDKRIHRYTFGGF